MTPRLSIGNMVSVSSVALLAVATVSVILLVGMIAALEQSMEVISRDTRSAAISDDIEVAALMYQRLSNLLHVTDEPAVADARLEVANQLERLLHQLPEHQGSRDEAALIGDLDNALSHYLSERDALDTNELDLSAVIRESRVPLGALLEVLSSLRELNDGQVTAAMERSARTNRRAIYLGIGAILLLVAGAFVPNELARRHLVQPILELHDAMASFRLGELGARGGKRGVRELGELSRMFNDMAATLEQQRRAQIEFLAGVAHDLKNPMSTLKNGIHLMAVESSEALRARTRAMLDAQVDLLVRMVDDFLDSARIEAGELELRCIEFDIRHVARDLIDAYGSVVPSRTLLFEPGPAPLVVSADPVRMDQVLRNLVSNALKYSTDGDVIVRTRAARTDALIEVVDHGPGIPEDERETIFLPFRRRKLNTAPGVGLGLSVVRRIVRAHGGTIEVDSAEGVGSTFRVRLPLLSDTG